VRVKDRPGLARLREMEGGHRNGTVIRDIVTLPEDGLSIPGNVSESGLALRPGLEYGEWAAVWNTLGRIERAHRWWIGDWLNYGEREYGQVYEEALPMTGLDYKSLRNCKWVSGQIELSRRRDNLSWGHHAEVASLEPDEQDHWLGRAEDNHWSQKELRNWLKGPKPLPEPGSQEIEPMPLLRFCQADLPTATIMTLILRVALPDAQTVLDVTYGSGAFWDGSAPVQVTAVDLNPTRALDAAVDFRQLPYADESFDVVTFDPPHLADAGSESIMRERFGTYEDADLEDVIKDGCREAWRVARLGIVVKVTDHVHGQRLVCETDWVKSAIDAPAYDVVHQTRSGAMVDPKWREQLSAYNNGSTYLIFRKDGPLHVRRG
jgi:hypothetical protein